MKFKLLVIGTFLATCVPAGLLAAEPAASPSPELAARLQWWREARFGMFIHWGPVSLKGTEIGWSRGAQIPIEEYDSLYKKFNPTKFDADAWVSVAKAAGMKYIILTTKHHDGFCLFDTKHNDYNVMNTPLGRDVTGELAAACRKQGIAFGTYHSVCDWYHPLFPLGSPGGSTKKPSPDLEAYDRHLRAQTTELIRNYGPLLIMWFDVPQMFDRQRGQALIDHVRGLQKDIIVNDRSGAPGDYDTPEQRVGAYQDHRPWETCMTICNQWAWKPDDPMKSLKECLQTLVKCAGGDGNLLFNVGPTPEGIIEDRQVQRLKEMGAWLEKYGQSVYATRGGPYKPTRQFASTRKGNVVYLHVFAWDGPALTLPPLGRKVVSSSLLTGGSVQVRQGAEGLTVTVPEANRREIDTIIKLELDGSAMDIAAIKIPRSEFPRVSSSNVFQKDVDNYGPEQAVDGDEATRWATDAGTHSAWLELDYGRPRRFSGVKMAESYDRVRKFEIQYKAGAEWKTCLQGQAVGPHYEKRFDPIEAQVVRLNILEAIEGPTLFEFSMLAEKP